MLQDPLGLGQLQIRETASVTELGRPSTSYSISLEDSGTARSTFIVRTRVCGQNRAGTPGDEAAATLKARTGPSMSSGHEVRLVTSVPPSQSVQPALEWYEVKELSSCCVCRTQSAFGTYLTMTTDFIWRKRSTTAARSAAFAAGTFGYEPI